MLLLMSNNILLQKELTNHMNYSHNKKRAKIERYPIIIHYCDNCKKGYLRMKLKENESNMKDNKVPSNKLLYL